MLTHIFLDVDKTLTTTSKVITPRTQQALLDVQRRGYSVALCTGRQWFFLSYIINLSEFFPLQRQHIISGGAQICTTDHQVIWQDLLPATTVEDIFQFARQEQVLLYSTNYSRILINQEEAAQAFPTTHPVDPSLILFAPEYNQPLSLINCHHLTPTFLAKLKQHKIHYKLMHGYHHEEYLDLTAAGVTKGSAIKSWAILNHVPLENVAMIGDSENDLEALQAVGQPHIMGNSVPEIQKFGFPTLGDTDADGLAIWLDSLPALT